jgi:choline dehydrogenase-like flavoprotein
LTVLLNAPCIEIRLDPGGSRADCAIIAPSPTKRCRVRAASFVLAAGGLETVRLLLASNNDRAPGLGNENDLVGRYYMTHLVGNLGRLTTLDGASGRELSFIRTTDGIYAKRSLQLSRTARRRTNLGAFVLRSSIGRVRDPSHGSGVLSALYLGRYLLKNELCVNMTRRSSGDGGSSGAGAYSRHLANVLRDSPSIVSFGYRWFVDRPRRYRKLPGYDLERRDHTCPLEFNAEQAPNHASRVYLGRALDPLGVPLLAVDWRSCEDDRRTVRQSFDLIRRALAGCNSARIASETEEEEAAAADLWPAGGHHIGTARWSCSPREGVVDPDMQVWSVRGLYVAGAAIFPRSGSANPTLSAVATAYRLADHLAALHPLKPLRS